MLLLPAEYLCCCARMIVFHGMLEFVNHFAMTMAELGKLEGISLPFKLQVTKPRLLHQFGILLHIEPGSTSISVNWKRWGWLSLP